ncbi:PREDICTED: uncharacterized protein LOC106146820 [Chinchilla lanigera]|uniref:uncharacterized protein LOC106146820 n=1 Tax=Chinchilla lanigera TaxID=34839 RepID=UPI00069844C9|nr:PREDICTED: uncharacterized protein LOC106146820 [Chinchilla lanigera]
MDSTRQSPSMPGGGLHGGSAPARLRLRRAGARGSAAASDLSARRGGAGPDARPAPERAAANQRGDRREEAGPRFAPPPGAGGDAWPPLSLAVVLSPLRSPRAPPRPRAPSGAYWTLLALPPDLGPGVSSLRRRQRTWVEVNRQPERTGPEGLTAKDARTVLHADLSSHVSGWRGESQDWELETVLWLAPPSPWARIDISRVGISFQGKQKTEGRSGTKQNSALGSASPWRPHPQQRSAETFGGRGTDFSHKSRHAVSHLTSSPL